MVVKSLITLVRLEIVEILVGEFQALYFHSFKMTSIWVLMMSDVPTLAYDGAVF